MCHQHDVSGDKSIQLSRFKMHNDSSRKSNHISTMVQQRQTGVGWGLHTEREGEGEDTWHLLHQPLCYLCCCLHGAATTSRLVDDRKIICNYSGEQFKCFFLQKCKKSLKDGDFHVFSILYDIKLNMFWFWTEKKTSP